MLYKVINKSIFLDKICLFCYVCPFIFLQTQSIPVYTGYDKVQIDESILYQHYVSQYRRGNRMGSFRTLTYHDWLHHGSNKQRTSRSIQGMWQENLIKIWRVWSMVCTSPYEAPDRWHTTSCHVVFVLSGKQITQSEGSTCTCKYLST